MLAWGSTEFGQVRSDSLVREGSGVTYQGQVLAWGVTQVWTGEQSLLCEEGRSGIKHWGQRSQTKDWC